MVEIIVAGITTLIILVVCIAAAGKQQQQFDNQWPPIPEDEFLAKCPPGTSRETALRVRKIIAEQIGVPYERIHPDQDFADDLDCC